MTKGAGTRLYMSPEQKKGKYDQRADIYSLGICIYEMLCPPCRTSMEHLQILTELSEQRKLSSSVQKNASPSLKAAILAMTHPDANQRPSLRTLSVLCDGPVERGLWEKMLEGILYHDPGSVVSSLVGQGLFTRFEMPERGRQFFSRFSIPNYETLLLYQFIQSRLSAVFRSRGAVYTSASAFSSRVPRPTCCNAKKPARIEDTEAVIDALSAVHPVGTRRKGYTVGGRKLHTLRFSLLQSASRAAATSAQSLPVVSRFGFGAVYTREGSGNALKENQQAFYDLALNLRTCVDFESWSKQALPHAWGMLPVISAAEIDVCMNTYDAISKIASIFSSLSIKWCIAGILQTFIEEVLLLTPNEANKYSTLIIEGVSPESLDPHISKMAPDRQREYHEFSNILSSNLGPEALIARLFAVVDNVDCLQCCRFISLLHHATMIREFFDEEAISHSFTVCDIGSATVFGEGLVFEISQDSKVLAVGGRNDRLVAFCDPAPDAWCTVSIGAELRLVNIAEAITSWNRQAKPKWGGKVPDRSPVLLQHEESLGGFMRAILATAHAELHLETFKLQQSIVRLLGWQCERLLTSVTGKELHDFANADQCVIEIRCPKQAVEFVLCAINPHARGKSSVVTTSFSSIEEVIETLKELKRQVLKRRESSN